MEGMVVYYAELWGGSLDGEIITVPGDLAGPVDSVPVPEIRPHRPGIPQERFMHTYLRLTDQPSKNGRWPYQYKETHRV